MSRLRMIMYPFAAAVAGALVSIVIGLSILGVHVSEWAEWHGRIMGLVTTLAGVCGAAIGLRIAAHQGPDNRIDHSAA